MVAVRVHDLAKKRILVTRDSARSLAPSLQDAVAESETGTVGLDFSGVEGITPSFLDEILAIIREHLGDRLALKVLIMDPPTRLSSKFEAVARGHGLVIRREETGNWVIEAEGLRS